MKNLIGAHLLLTIFITFFICLSTLGLAQQGDVQSVQGNVFCVELDEKGVLNVKEEWTECSGTLVAIGADGKSYIISGTVEDTKMMMKQPDKKKKEPPKPPPPKKIANQTGDAIHDRGNALQVSAC